MGNIGKVYLISILLCIISSAAFSGSPEVTVVIDGYTVDTTQSSPASLPLGTALVLVCRVSGIPQRQIKYNWTCPGGPCERPGYAGRKVDGNILAVNITSYRDEGTYTCEVSREEADGGYNQNYTLNVSGGNVIHSYGRLVHREHVITVGDQLLPPGDVTGPGRLDCIRIVPETARFDVTFIGGQPPNNLVNRSDGGDEQMAILFFNRSYLSMNSFKNLEGSCGTYFYLYLRPGKLPNVTIMSVVPYTTDARIVLNDIPSDNIGRVIVGYERHDFGVTLQGEYANIERSTQHTFSSLVPGARYTVVVQGLTGAKGDRSEHVTRRDFKTEEKEPSATRYPCILGESSNGIVLNWIPPLEPNGDVYYLIEYNDGKKTASLNTSGGSTYFNLTGLQRGVTYNITVVAINSVGRNETGPVLNYTRNIQINTPSQNSSTSSKNSPTGVIIVVTVVIMILLVIITVLVVAVTLILKRKKQPPTVQCEQSYEEVDDIVKTNQDYQELDVNKMDDDVMTSTDYQKLNVRTMDSLNDVVMNKRGYPGLNASKRNDNMIVGEDYEELDPKMLDETTKYASLN